jgi:heme exporter protein D
MDLGPYAGFIVTAYAAVIVIVAGLVAWVVLDRRHLVRVIAEMEAQGASRRSERKGEETP